MLARLRAAALFLVLYRPAPKLRGVVDQNPRMALPERDGFERKKICVNLYRGLARGRGAAELGKGGGELLDPNHAAFLTEGAKVGELAGELVKESLPISRRSGQ